jgi:hypothetical protein
MNAGTRVAIVLAITLAVVLIGGGALFYYQNQKNVSPAQQDQKVLEEVGKLIDLPAGETPQIATVTDPEKLKTQEFFQKAKSGDKVLIYANARKAILYDPTAKKIIDVAPVNTGTPSAQTQEQIDASASAAPQP